MTNPSPRVPARTDQHQPWEHSGLGGPLRAPQGRQRPCAGAGAGLRGTVCLAAGGCVRDAEVKTAWPWVRNKGPEICVAQYLAERLTLNRESTPCGSTARTLRAYRPHPLPTCPVPVPAARTLRPHAPCPPPAPSAPAACTRHPHPPHPPPTPSVPVTITGNYRCPLCSQPNHLTKLNSFREIVVTDEDMMSSSEGKPRC